MCYIGLCDTVFLKLGLSSLYNLLLPFVLSFEDSNNQKAV